MMHVSSVLKHTAQPHRCIELVVYVTIHHVNQYMNIRAYYVYA